MALDVNETPNKTELQDAALPPEQDEIVEAGELMETDAAAESIGLTNLSDSVPAPLTVEQEIAAMLREDGYEVAPVNGETPTDEGYSIGGEDDDDDEPPSLFHPDLDPYIRTAITNVLIRQHATHHVLSVIPPDPEDNGVDAIIQFKTPLLAPSEWDAMSDVLKVIGGGTTGDVYWKAVEVRVGALFAAGALLGVKPVDEIPAYRRGDKFTAKDGAAYTVMSSEGGWVRLKTDNAQHNMPVGEVAAFLSGKDKPLTELERQERRHAAEIASYAEHIADLQAANQRQAQTIRDLTSPDAPRWETEFTPNVTAAEYTKRLNTRWQREFAWGEGTELHVLWKREVLVDEPPQRVLVAEATPGASNMQPVIIRDIGSNVITGVIVDDKLGEPVPAPVSRAERVIQRMDQENIAAGIAFGQKFVREVLNK